ncbi:MAG: hypothetical protein ABJA81_05590 [Nocardioidaceae bacterium]
MRLLEFGDPIERRERTHRRCRAARFLEQGSGQLDVATLMMLRGIYQRVAKMPGRAEVPQCFESVGEK